MEDRRHIAIMFTDIVGYTALMGSDEDKAFDLLKRNHTIHETLINKHNGTLIKEVGDGTLASFPLASDAVRCAMDIQVEAKSQEIPLKIGIHEGEMVMAGDDVLGDGVNVASRLQEISADGCITISGKVYSDVKNKTGITTKYIGDKKLKNVSDPVKVYEVLCEKQEPEQIANHKSKLPYFIIIALVIIITAIVIWIILPRQPDIEIEKSIAVLPFRNDSPDPENEYFCNGMMETILNHLVQVGDMKVLSRTDVEPYRDTEKSRKEISSELGVANLLEGSVQKQGNRFRINVQLFNAENGFHLWSNAYEGEYTDELFTVQSNIAQQVAAALKAVITPDEELRIETVPTDNMIAYDYYQKGNQAYWRSWNPPTREYVDEAIEYYEKAIELDQSFSLAFTGLGRAYWRIGKYVKSKSNLNKAIELDPYNGWAYAEMSVVSITWDWDSAATRQNLEMAIKLLPNDFNAYIHSFYFELRLGNCDKMMAIQKDYKRFNENVDLPFNTWSLLIKNCQKKYAEIARLADEYWQDELNPRQVWPVFFSYIYLSEYKKAGKVVAFVRDSFETKWMYFSLNGVLKAKEGDRETALAMCDSLEENSSKVWTAAIYAALGNKQKMYEYLDKAIFERQSLHQTITIFPDLISCENDPEYQRIKREIWIPRGE